MKLKQFILLLLFVLLTCNLVAQKSKKIAISGTVMDVNENPVADAIILIDNKKTNVTTDMAGNFKIDVNPKASRIGILTFACGYVEEDIEGRSNIDIKFTIAAKRKDLTQNSSGSFGLGGQNPTYGEESVEVGYGHMKRKYITSDITYIDGTEKKFESYHSVIDMIQRHVAGARVSRGGVILQGSGNMSGSVPALIVIDGVPGCYLDDVSPSSVESISVLKGTAAAIYGSRGFGGAILIKTRK